MMLLTDSGFEIAFAHMACKSAKHHYLVLCIERPRGPSGTGKRMFRKGKLPLELVSTNQKAF